MTGNEALADAPVDGDSVFSEARGFERIYHRNPEAQARGVQFILGFLAVHEGPGTAVPESEEIVSGLRLALRDFMIRYPEFLVRGEIDAELGGGEYKPSPQLLATLLRVLESD